jgi:hypothetical protein
MNFGTARRIIFLVLTLVIIIAIILGIISFARFFTKQPEYVFTTNSRTVIKQLQSLSRLETAQYTIEKVIDAGKSGNQFQQLLFGDKILLIAQGEVIAGFDFAKLTENDIVIEGTTLRLELPGPQILVTKLNNDQTRVYDRRLGLLSKGDKDLESKAREKAEALITQGACDGHILDTASTNARAQLTTLFKSLGFTTVIITIPQATCVVQS